MTVKNQQMARGEMWSLFKISEGVCEWQNKKRRILNIRRRLMKQPSEDESDMFAILQTKKIYRGKRSYLLSTEERKRVVLKEVIFF